MKKGRFSWRRFYRYCPRQPFLAWQPWCYGETWRSKWKTTDDSSRPTAHSGFLLVSLLLILPLLSLFLLESLKVAELTQKRIALQARLDICAVRLASRRKAALERLAKLNMGLKTTALGIYAARGLRVAGPAGAALGGTTEAALLRVNQALAVSQEAIQALPPAPCESTEYSHDLVFCVELPPLQLGLRRERALFPDVKGVLVHKSSARDVAKVSCTGGRQMATTLAILGDPWLRRPEYRDEYR